MLLWYFPFIQQLPDSIISYSVTELYLTNSYTIYTIYTKKIKKYIKETKLDLKHVKLLSVLNTILQIISPGIIVPRCTLIL